MSAPIRLRNFGRVLVSAQVALSVLLLVGAGLFVQTLRNLSRLEMGYSTERLLEVAVDTRFAGYKENQVPTLSRLLLERIGAVPGVRSASWTKSRLMQGSSMSMALPIRGLPEPNPALPEREQMWEGLEVGPQFFETMGIEAVRGRTFTAADFAMDSVDMRNPPARPPQISLREFVRRIGPFIINESLARRFPPNADPLAPGTFIVGIVKDAKLFSVKEDVGPIMFLVSRRPDRISAILVRAAGDPLVIEKALREAVQGVNPQLLSGMITLGEASSRSIARERMVAAISGFFSLLGLVLAAIGVFGIASSAVAQRTKELGIRRALGASQWALVSASLWETMVVFGLGLIAGAVVAFVIMQVTSSLIADLLFGLRATNAVNLSAAIITMVLVALTACTLPAFRAARVDPLLFLREE